VITRKDLKKYAPEIPEITCPDINYVCCEIRESLRDAGHKCYDTEQDLRNRLDQIQHHLWDLDGKMESIRAANDALRRSSQYWYDECKALTVEIGDSVEAVSV